MVLECSSALKGPFTALFAVRFCYGRCLNGPFQGRIVGRHGTQGFADFALGWWNELFRLKDGRIRDIPDRESNPLLALRAGMKTDPVPPSKYHSGRDSARRKRSRQLPTMDVEAMLV